MPLKDRGDILPPQPGICAALKPEPAQNVGHKLHAIPVCTIQIRLSFLLAGSYAVCVHAGCFVQLELCISLSCVVQSAKIGLIGCNAQAKQVGLIMHVMQSGRLVLISHCAFRKDPAHILHRAVRKEVSSPKGTRNAPLLVSTAKIPH